MSVSLIWDGKTLIVPEVMGTPASHQLTSTQLDNLVEIAGRICYDSLGMERSRNSPDYHQHIVDVGHLSVQEHAVFTVEFSAGFDGGEFLYSFINRIGSWLVSKGNNRWRVTTNLRAVREWDNFGLPNGEPDSTQSAVGAALRAVAQKLCPLAMAGTPPSDSEWAKLVEPETDDEVWVTLLFYDLSRGFSHELVRHGDFTGISQRSTRYVDECDTNWSWHPLIKKHTASGDMDFILATEKVARAAYAQTVPKLEKAMIAAGTDKFTARKQARGAARGVLGNALATEVVFSASISQWKRMILMRAHEAADGEIRLAFDDAYLILKELMPARFDGWTQSACADGIGFQVNAPAPQ